MSDMTQPTNSGSATAPDSEELQIIFDTIEDNLAFWKILYNDVIPSPGVEQPNSLTQASTVADWLKMSSAPLYPSQSIGGLRGIVYRFLNLAIKVIGTPQIRFNRKFRDFLGELLLILQGYNTQALDAQSTINALKSRVQLLETENRDFQAEIKMLSDQVDELRSEFIDLSEQCGTKKRA